MDSQERSSTGHGAGLGDLPESAIACVLSLTSPRDVARMACVSRSFQVAAESDVVWERMLPAFYADILAEAADAPPLNDSPKRDIYNFLCQTVLLRNGSRDFRLDRASGLSSQSIAARELSVSWGSDDRYWSWRAKDGARYGEVAYLNFVWWLEVRGTWQCRLSPGTYVFSWRLSLGTMHRHDYDNIGPVTFSFEATGNAPVCTECHLTGQGARFLSGDIEGKQQPLGYRWNPNNWMELDVGEFTVGDEGNSVDIAFDLKDIESRTKGDMYIDGVVIRPSSTIQRRIALT